MTNHTNKPTMVELLYQINTITNYQSNKSMSFNTVELSDGSQHIFRNRSEFLNVLHYAHNNINLVPKLGADITEPWDGKMTKEDFNNLPHVVLEDSDRLDEIGILSYIISPIVTTDGMYSLV